MSKEKPAARSATRASTPRRRAPRAAAAATADGAANGAAPVAVGAIPSIFTSATPDFAARMVASEGGSPTREAIIRAGMNLFAEYGYHASTLRKLAEQVGIEAGSLYNHMASKNELLSDMLVFGTGEVL